MPDMRAVLFDLDQTLFDRTSSLIDFLNHQWSSQAALQSTPREAYVENFLKLDENGKVWKDIVYRSLIEIFSIRGIEADALLEDYLSHFHKYARLYPDVTLALRLLKEQGFKLGIITNGRVDLQSSVIKACGFDAWMDVILISEAEKIKKPDPAIFARALERLEVLPAAAVFVGDNPDADIRGAHEAGMETIWFQNANFDPPDPAITSAIFGAYRNLPHIVGRLVKT